MVPLVMLQKSDSHYTKENERKYGNETRVSFYSAVKILILFDKMQVLESNDYNIKYVAKIVDGKKSTNNLLAGRYKDCYSKA